jgi:lysozyme
MKLPNSSLPWPITMEAVALIAEREGCRLKAYRCPAGVWTCGWGETDGVGPETVWTQEYADQRFCDSLTEYTQRVRDMLTVAPTPEQLGAMVSFAYNIGLGSPSVPKKGFLHSSVRRFHNEGKFNEAARSFGLQNTAVVNGVRTELPGLTRRRAAEAALYLKGLDPVPMVQNVEPESSLVQSPIQQSGVVTLATGALALAGSAFDSVRPLLKDAVEMAGALGVSPGAVLGVVLLVTGGTTVYWRWKQRRGGWT